MTGNQTPEVMEAGAAIAETMSPSENAKPVLDDVTRDFVRNALAAGLVEIADVKKVVVSLMANDEDTIFNPRRLAAGLKGAGILTSWQANKLLAGRSKGFYLGSYRLLKPIGKGGMGMVYLGEHHVMKRLMALKILPPEATGNPQRLARFKEEARACAQLDHPNIVRAYDFAEAGGRFYIVMEYVDGIDLHHLVARDGLMSTAEVIDVVLQACDGLSHAHERGIVHRDVKPANLLMRTDGVLKVSDLGLARIGMSGVAAAEEHRLLGTADFVAPEQAINSHTIDARADIYSLGCTLYFLLTGQPPFQGDSVKQRLAKHQTAEIPDVRTLRQDCPAAIADLTRRMMAKRPEDRPKSTAELSSQLSRIGGGSTDRPSFSNRLIKPADTSIDEQVYSATIDDTTMVADSDVAEAVLVTDEVDLGQALQDFGMDGLPAVAADNAAGTNPMAAFPATNGSPDQQGGRKKAGGKHSGVTARAGQAIKKFREDGAQTLMLGVGLTVAVIALLGVLTIAYHNLTKPLPTIAPKIKKIEDGGRDVIIVNPSLIKLR